MLGLKASDPLEKRIMTYRKDNFSELVFDKKL